MRLSVIVPIYNVEKYLRKCVDSLLCQDIPQEEYEIILVDDGSTDGSGKIADEYAAEYGNATAVHQKNGGLSAARNAGLDIAKGEYVEFVDSDDYLDANVLGGLLRRAEEENLDVLRFNYRNVDENGEPVQTSREPMKGVDLSETVCSGKEFLDRRMGIACYACQFILKRALTASCRFREGICFEDTEWTPRMLLAARRTSSSPLVSYNYLVRSGSITRATSREKKLKLMEDRILIIGLQKELSDGKDGTGGSEWFARMRAALSLGVLEGCAADFYSGRKDIIGRLRALGVFPLCTDGATKSGLRKMRIINFSPSLFCFIIHLIRR